MRNIKNAFTLIEIMVSILIISIVILSGFQLFSMILASKIKISEQLKLEKNIFYFSEKLFTLIKKGGTLDYEEYFNRRVSDYFFDDKINNGHWNNKSGFGNFGAEGNIGTESFGNGFYYCIGHSTDIYKNSFGISYPEWIKKGCFHTSNYNKVSKNKNSSSKNNFGKSQRYGQYSYQFIDYNSDANDDFGDANGDGRINRDDDDKYLGIGPEVFEHGENVHELYLISGDKKKRTYFRWNIKQDEFSDTISSFPKCTSNFQYCRGTIEFLELEGKDWGMNHDGTGEYANDGVIDTWLIASNFSGKTNIDKDSSIIAGSSKDTGFWKPLFSDDINISDFKVYAYPNIDSSKVWNITADEQEKYLISPYVILSIEIKPSWKVKRKIKGDIKPVKFNTTINLTDIFSNSN